MAVSSIAQKFALLSIADMPGPTDKKGPAVIVGRTPQLVL